jgi:hypothetical protein
MRSTLRGAFTFVCLLAAGGLLAQTSPTPPRVLFLGNSLTDGNNVPALVQAMAQLQGVHFEYVALAPGGYAIEDHWTDGHQSRLQQGNFAVLVLQQGPSTLPDSQAHLRQWAQTWANEARRFGTQPALYMIWPVRTQANGFALVSQSYRNAALAADAAVFPAGEAWEQVIREDPAIALYTADNLHATPAGSFLAAMVIARGLVGLDPARVPTNVAGLILPAATVARFRAVVATLPAASLIGPDAPAVPAPATSPTPAPGVSPTPAPSAATPAAGPGGGGAPSGWFCLALLAARAARLLRHRLGQSDRDD